MQNDCTVSIRDTVLAIEQRILALTRRWVAQVVGARLAVGTVYGDMAALAGLRVTGIGRTRVPVGAFLG